ncbi:MAG TPA: immunoglobulin domain-containing protein [Candidatus Paceibacterota bacterium]|nr:immunoglobulin domain-containing protein [Candidatus Paceibacterota bacterium]
MKKRNQTYRLASLLVLMASLAATSAQVAVPASFAHPKDQANANTRGFKVRVVQANSDSGTLANSVARVEAHLAGTLIDPKTQQPYVNVADTSVFGADGYYNEPYVIDYEQGGNATALIPGIPNPNTPDYADNISLEALAYLELDPGTYSMGVNSDDGFRVTVGPDARDQFYALELGKYDGGRSATDSIFTFTISQAGLYSFRLIYMEGNGGANVQWFTGTSDNKVYINDPNNPPAVKAYRELKTATGPYIQLLNPAVEATAAMPNTTLNGVIVDGASAQVVASSIQLFLDGAQVEANPQKTGNKTTYSYKPAAMFKPLSKHQVKLIFSDTASNTRTNEYQFTVAEFGNIVLPAPFFLENFDQAEEGSLPTGWTVQNFSDGAGAGPDLDSPNSDSYLDWVIVSRDRIQAIGDAGGWDANHRLSMQSGQFINGEEVTSLVISNFAYAESDQRSGTQVQYLFSPDINCSGKSSVFLSYFSTYTQNQDNIGSVEYSIDGGATWLPIVYMIDAADIINDTEGNIDAFATLNAERTDAAHLLDPVSGEEIGLKYGAFIGVLSNKWAELGPYISGRINDDSLESKRVELFRLPQADNQAKVRLRFAQAGTASWYFGIDNVGLYVIEQAIAPKITEAPQSQSASAGSTIAFTVKATGTEPLKYQWKFNDAILEGKTEATLTLANVKTANAGQYSVVVSNEGGEAVSAPATLEVFSGTITENLVAHLKFDNDLKDSSGKNNHGTEVGAPTFASGKIGQAVHIPSGADYVSLGTPADLNFGTDTDFSVSFWAKLIAWDSDPSFIGNKNWNSGGNQGWVLATDGDGHFQWNLAGGPGSRKDYDGAPGLFSDQNWHHIVVTFKRSGNAVSYVDGAQVDSRSLTVDQNNVDTPAEMATNIGQDGTGAYGPAFTDADMDDIGIWRRALTPQEVAAIHTAGLAGKDLSTVSMGPSDLGSLSYALSGGNLTLTWTAGTGVRLQKSAALSPAAWQDVANTEGKGSAVEATSGSAAFYRLFKP